MTDDMEDNGGDVSDAMSENEYDDDNTTIKDEDDKMAEHDGNGEVKKKYDPKDPSRPRRKKARRACFACQRAHLTCGDERPCQRCIKRGLADACQDGVRKKAKYLHDAPPEALRPVLGPNYNPTPAARPSSRRQTSNASETASTAGSTFYSQTNSSSFPVYSNAQTPVNPMPDGIQFPTQPSPMSPTFQQPPNSARSNMSSMISPQMTNDPMGFNTLFDPSNPAIFNFDLEGLNFGSQYGAMEFGMLGHMSSGAGETPPRDPSLSGPSGDVNFGAGVFGNGNSQYSQVYNDGMINDFMNIDQGSNSIYGGTLQHGLPHAFAIAAGSNSHHSPSTETTASPQTASFNFEGSPSGTFGAVGGQQSLQQQAVARPKTKGGAGAKSGPAQILGKRQRDPSWIYESVKEPYQYLAGFHALIAFLKDRFSANKTLRIAKALASVRPSFITSTQNLDRQDLIFMEKCFQRTLFEFEDYMHQCSSPSIVCRRTGEIAAVNKEFTALTGWSKDVLLGNKPNLNINIGGNGGISTSTSGANTGRAGVTTPKLPNATLDAKDSGRKQPMFIAEILDDDSVIEFYEDFAELAFQSSRSSAQRNCRVLKYRTKEAAEAAQMAETTPKRDPRKSILSNRVTKIDGEHGISRLEKDGKVDCRYCWTIKRDVFDIPMLIVMNFLPCYYRIQETQAV
ncbi:transcription factor [Plectosphaerella plurivora]|uniref:Transcription factor n=1 Tax=Plectosphaerella plurivora TaxID=936078 RepID=A0A9P8V780_9PEZI|nr:transcription factor [Plectosphaerella plurivora]